MRQVVARAQFLLRRPVVLGVGACVVVGGSLAVPLPLLGVPGFELSLLLSILIGLLGGVVGAAAGAQERRLLLGRDPRPPGAVRSESPPQAAFLAIAAGALVNLAFVLPPLLVATLFAVASTACDPFEHVGFVPLLPLPSALLASAAGVFCALATRRKVTCVLLYVALVLSSGAATAWPIVFGPQVYAYNHLLGFLPGPLYDEALAVTPAMGWFRAQTLLLTACLWLIVAVLLDLREGRLRRPHLRGGPLVLLAALLVCVFAIEERAPSAGYRMSDGHLTEALGGVRESEHFILVHPRSKPRLELDRMLRDLEFRHAQLSPLLGEGPSRKIRVYLYGSAQEKHALVGAGRTQFAKPWRGELHIHDAPFPHPVLKHELAHVMAAPLGAGPFGVTSRFKLFPVMGIIEGLAVAADDAVDELTLHQWAAGMRQQGLAPDVREILGPRGFYQSAAARAYTVVGSFLRYLADTYGAEKLRALYARGDFEASYGRTLDALASEWERHLESVTVAPSAQAQAFARYRQPSLFARTCAREVATLHARASQQLASDPEAALEGFRRCSDLQPEEPTYQLGQAAALARLQRHPEARALLKGVTEKVQDKPALQAELLLAQADLATEVGDATEAAALLQQVLALETSASVERTARVKRAALASPASGEAVLRYFQGGPDELRLLRLREALEAQPGNSAVAYLLGRRLVQLGEAQRAVPYLTQTLAAAELPDSMARESHRLLAEALYLSGDCDGVRDVSGRLPGLGEVLRRQVSEWVERCDFEQRVFKSPLVPPGRIR